MKVHDNGNEDLIPLVESQRPRQEPDVDVAKNQHQSPIVAVACPSEATPCRIAPLGDRGDARPPSNNSTRNTDYTQKVQKVRIIIHFISSLSSRRELSVLRLSPNHVTAPERSPRSGNVARSNDAKHQAWNQPTSESAQQT